MSDATTSTTASSPATATTSAATDDDGGVLDDFFSFVADASDDDNGGDGGVDAAEARKAEKERRRQERQANWKQHIIEAEEKLKRMNETLEDKARIAYEMKAQYHAKAAVAYKMKTKVKKAEEALEEFRKRLDPEQRAEWERQQEEERLRRLHDNSHPQDFDKRPQDDWKESIEHLKDGNCLQDCVAVLVRTNGPMNLGLISRTCANLGVKHLRLVAPECEVSCMDSRKFANHAVDLMMSAPVYATLAEAVTDCQLVIGTSGRDAVKNGAFFTPEQIPQLLAKTIKTYKHHAVNEGGEAYEVKDPDGDVAYTLSPRDCEGVTEGRYAVVFGNESHGMNGDELAQCQAYVCIPTRSFYTSYNLSQAVAITLYSISRSRRDCDEPLEAMVAEQHTAPRGYVDAMFRFMVATMDRVEWPHIIRSSSRSSVISKMQNTIKRHVFSQDAVTFTFGMLKYIHRRVWGDDGNHLIGRYKDLSPTNLCEQDKRPATDKRKEKHEAKKKARETLQGKGGCTEDDDNEEEKNDGIDNDNDGDDDTGK